MVLAKFNVWSSNLRSQLKVVWLQDKILIVLFLVSLFLNVVLYSWIAWKIKPVADPLVLHYSVYFGIDLIGQWYELYLMPIVGSFILLINFILFLAFYKKQVMAGYLLAGAALLVEIFLLIGGYLMIMVNF